MSQILNKNYTTLNREINYNHSGYEQPVRTRPWPTYDKGFVVIDETDIEAVTNVVRSKLLFRYDYRDYHETVTGQFENSLRNYFEVKHVLAVNSGTSAITLALRALQLPHDAKVGVTTFTFTATPSAIIQAGCQPCLIEVDDQLFLDLDDLERKLPKLDALVVVHMRGYAEQIDKIVDLANRYGVPVVEDAVPALGLAIKGRLLGTFGQLGAFSTQSDKSLNTGEGGFVVTNNDLLYQRCVIMSGAYEKRWASHFQDENLPQGDDIDYPLFNCRMDEIRAALALSQLGKLPSRVEKLRVNYQHAEEELNRIPGVQIRRPVYENGVLGDSLQFRIEGANIETTCKFAAELRREGITVRALGDDSKPNVCRFWDWRYMFGNLTSEEIKTTFPQSARYLSEMIDVPMSLLLTHEDIEEFIYAMHKVVLKMGV